MNPNQIKLCNECPDKYSGCRECPVGTKIREEDLKTKNGQEFHRMLWNDDKYFGKRSESFFTGAAFMTDPDE